MKRITLLFATILFIGLSVQIGFAQDTKEKNKQLLIGITEFLEEKPFDEKAESARKNAFTFVAQTKDVSVVMCTDLTKDALKKKNKYGGELLIQYSLGMAAYKLENPDKKDENAAQLAGLESMLKSYEAMVAEKPDAKFQAMDELITKRDNGELKTLIDTAGCGKSKKNKK
ncbi:MAG: hypothetical protein ACR2MD_16495 [Aridibacter sp.]